MPTRMGIWRRGRGVGTRRTLRLPLPVRRQPPLRAHCSLLHHLYSARRRQHHPAACGVGQWFTHGRGVPLTPLRRQVQARPLLRSLTGAPFRCERGWSRCMGHACQPPCLTRVCCRVLHCSRRSGPCRGGRNCPRSRGLRPFQASTQTQRPGLCLVPRSHPAAPLCQARGAAARCCERPSTRLKGNPALLRAIPHPRGDPLQEACAL